MSKKIQLTVNEGLHNELEKLANKQLRTVQDVINNILAEYVLSSGKPDSTFEAAFTR